MSSLGDDGTTGYFHLLFNFLHFPISLKQTCILLIIKRIINIVKRFSLHPPSHPPTHSSFSSSSSLKETCIPSPVLGLLPLLPRDIVLSVNYILLKLSLPSLGLLSLDPYTRSHSHYPKLLSFNLTLFLLPPFTTYIL